MSTEIAEYIYVAFGIALIGGFPIWLYVKHTNDEKKRHKHHSEVIHKNS